MLNLRPFQRRAVRALESGRYDTVVLSTPRAQGKSTLAAHLCHRALTPGDSLNRPGTESHLVASTIAQSRKTCFKLLRRMIEDSDTAAEFSISESVNGCHVRHKATNTRVSVVAGSARATLGLVGCPLVVVDEPGAYELTAGAELWSAVDTALGKPESPLRVFVIGHLAPKATAPGHWFYDLAHTGTTGRTHVQLIQGRRKLWDRASEIRRCSPLSWDFPESRAKLIEQRDAARGDSGKLASFLSYRLNLPSPDESAVLLDVATWEVVCARQTPPREGRPMAGADLGGGRAWSAAAAVWPNGRVEAVAVAPGIPDLRAQEQRDRVVPGSYERLRDAGVLRVADGLRVPPPAMLADLIRPWGPRVVVCDRFRLGEFQDAGRLPLVPRVTRWSSAAEDIRGLRKLAKDGPLAVDPDSRTLLEASLAVATVKSDDQGSVRLVKRGSNNTARDDVAAALTLAAGAAARMPKRSRGAFIGVAG